MLPPTLWVEIIIAGFVYLVAVTFLILNKAGVSDLQFLADLKDLTALATILIVFASYILGLLTHRLLQLVLLVIIDPLLKLMGIKFNVIGDTRKDFFSMNFVLQQYGSQFLHREIDLQYSAFALFSSLVVSLPLLGWSLSRWLITARAPDWASPTAFWTGIILSGAFLIVNIRQRKNFNGIRDEAFKELMKIHRKNLGSKKTD